jgi:hypothetical protein
MKFTEYFADATISRPSSLARGWDMPELPQTGDLIDCRPSQG